MPFWGHKDTTPTDTPTAPVAPQVTDLGKQSGHVSLIKGQKVTLEKRPDGLYTLIARWGRKDYDLFGLVEYYDGHDETVSCFGTTAHKRRFSMRTKDGAVIHITGDQATSDSGGPDLPQEIIHVRLNDKIKAIAMVVYSAKNSGVGSFHDYRVSTYVAEGLHQDVPTSGTRVSIEAADANRDEYVYTLVPVVIHNTPAGPVVEAVELYSKPHSEQRPVLRDGRVTMDEGPENAKKPRPRR